MPERTTHANSDHATVAHPNDNNHTIRHNEVVDAHAAAIDAARHLLLDVHPNKHKDTPAERLAYTRAIASAVSLNRYGANHHDDEDSGLNKEDSPKTSRSVE